MSDLPRWVEVAKKEPHRWIEHAAPAVSHYAYEICQVCIYNPVDHSEQEYADLLEENKALKEDSQLLTKENMELSERAVDRNHWKIRALRAEEILRGGRFADQHNDSEPEPSPQWSAAQMRSQR